VQRFPRLRVENQAAKATPWISKRSRGVNDCWFPSPPPFFERYGALPLFLFAAPGSFDRMEQFQQPPPIGRFDLKKL
jgi:hypothetical protein